MKNKAAQQLGRLGGKSKSEAKASAVRENGKKGGRPAYGIQSTDYFLVVKFRDAAERNKWVEAFEDVRLPVTTAKLKLANAAYGQCFVDSGNCWNGARFEDRTNS